MNCPNCNADIRIHSPDDVQKHIDHLIYQMSTSTTSHIDYWVGQIYFAHWVIMKEPDMNEIWKKYRALKEKHQRENLERLKNESCKLSKMLQRQL